MRYTVVALPPAEANLARIWMAAPDRQAVTAAANRIDRALATDPEQKGRAMGQFRVYEDSPLSVLFHVDPGDRMVRILSVRRTN